MRTTINIDDDVLEIVKAVARRDRKSVGEVVSAMLREAVEPSATGPGRMRNGIPLFPVSSNAGVVTPELVKELLADVPTLFAPRFTEVVRRAVIPASAPSGKLIREHYRNGGGNVSDDYLDSVEKTAAHDPVPEDPA